MWRALKNIDLVEGFQGVAFGTMDGLITILGVVIGIATATDSSAIVIISGVVVGVANSFGNSFGFYASELAERAEHMQENQHVSSMAETRRSTVLAFRNFTSINVSTCRPLCPADKLELCDGCFADCCVGDAFRVGGFGWEVEPGRPLEVWYSLCSSWHSRSRTVVRRWEASRRLADPWQMGVAMVKASVSFRLTECSW